MNVLRIRYQLECTLHYQKGLPDIYLKPSSFSLLCSIILLHMCPPRPMGDGLISNTA